MDITFLILILVLSLKSKFVVFYSVLTLNFSSEYCLNKAEITNDQHKKFIWHFLKANFEQNPRAELLNLLGYRIEDVNGKLSQFVGKQLQNNVDGLVDDFNNMNRVRTAYGSFYFGKFYKLK